MNARPFILLSTLATIGLLMVTGLGTASAAEQRVTDLSVSEGTDATQIRVRTDAPPTYSAYRLRSPERLIVDISGAELAAPQQSFDVHNGVVRQVAAVAHEDSFANVVRVMITLERETLYDVTTDGLDVLISVDGAARRPQHVAGSGESELREELNAARDRIEALETASDAAAQAGNQEEAELLRDQADAERAQRETLEGRLAQLEGELAASDRELQDIRSSEAETRRALEARDEEVAALRAEVDAAEAAGRDRAEVEALRRELVEAQEREARLQREADSLRASATIETAEPAAAAPPAAERPTGVRDVRFEQQGDRVRVAVVTDRDASWRVETWEDGLTALILEGASLPGHLERRLDTSAFRGAVRSVSSYREGSDVIVAAEVTSGAEGSVRQSGGMLHWEFDGGAERSGGSRAPVASRPVEPVHTSQADLLLSRSSAQGERRQTSRRPRMAAKRISIDLRNADIQNVLRLLAEEGNINIIAGDDVSGSVTLRLQSVPLDEAFVLILRTRGLGWEQEGNTVRVAPLSVFEDEYQRELQRLADSYDIAPLAVRLIPVNYANAREVVGLINGLMSSRGSVVVDQRTNTLILTDVQENLNAAEQLVQQLDTQTPQILIEARIVETNDQFRRQLGIQWGGSMLADQSLGNATGLLFPSTIGIAGGATDGQTPTEGTTDNPNFAVNLPAPTGTGEGGALGFTFGSLGGAFNLNLRLSAAESQGSVKIISAPRIMTLDNEQASISSGVSIPVSVVSAAGAQTVFFDASLSLDVTPRVTPDGTIFLDVQITKNEPDFENTGARGDPSITRREASTQLLVRDGDTTVIGGVFQRNSGFSNSSVPFFGRLPIFGPLFRNSSTTDIRNELMVFITPRVVNRDLSVDRIGRGDEIVPPSQN